MRIKARAKINWALNVLSKRTDGYHELDMLNQRLTLADDITLTPADGISLSLTGSVSVPAGPDNLVFRAASLMRRLGGAYQGVHITLHKRIPSGAGLAGGSADAAAVMLGLNQLWGLHLPLQKLREAGRSLGADIPYCLAGGFARVGGTGELIGPLPGAPVFPLILLQPAQSLSTQTVFEHLDAYPPVPPADIPGLIRALGQRDADRLRLAARNHLQRPAAALCPDIQDALEDLTRCGALFVQMSGAGSAVYGIFKSAPVAREAETALREKWAVCLTAQTMPY